jgi:hypothetical protein
MAARPNPEEVIYESISSSLDRFREAHFWLHKVEEHYHSAELFRWHLNAFLRATKEVPQLLMMELQVKSGFKDWFKSKRESLSNDPLFSVFSKHRDFVVHRGMLVPNSSAFVGITEGRGLKLGFRFPVHPMEDSDSGMSRFLAVTKEQGDFFGILVPDEDSLPCVERYWRLPDFEEDIGDICARAWLRLGETVADVLTWLGANPPSLSLDCRHASQEVHYRTYSRERLQEWMAELP